MDRIRLTASVAEKLRAHHLAPGKSEESLSFAYGRLIEVADEWLVLIAHPSQVLLLAEDCFVRRSAGYVSVRADVRAGVYWRACQLGFDVVVDIHDHFFSDVANFSDVDDCDDLRTAAWFRDKLSEPAPAGPLRAVSMLLAQQDWSARRVVTDATGAASFRPLLVDILDESFQRFGPLAADELEMHARQSAIIDTRAQAVLRSLRLAIVGAGGTGSIAVESAARLGIGEIVLIDGDTIEPSNLNRLQGASPNDVAQNKAQWAVTRATAMFPETRFEAVSSSVFTSEALSALTCSDVALVCVDNNESSWYLNRVCLQYAIPYWNVGVLIEREPRIVMHSRVNAVIPGLTPCGECSDIQFFARKQPDRFLDTKTLEAQRAAGYVTNTPATAPAIAAYSLNQQAVGSMFTEMTSWVCGWWPMAHSIYSKSSDPAQQRLDRSTYTSGPAEHCAICSFLMGAAGAERVPRQDATIELTEQ